LQRVVRFRFKQRGRETPYAVAFLIIRMFNAAFYFVKIVNFAL